MTTLSVDDVTNCPRVRKVTPVTKVTQSRSPDELPRQDLSPTRQQIMPAHNVQRVALGFAAWPRSVRANCFPINKFHRTPTLVPWVQFQLCLRPSGALEHRLTTLFGAVESAELPIVQEATSKKHGWLPLLTVLFLISYGLMTMLIVEQGQTIESQRALIRELFRDSTELSAVKMRAHQQAIQTPAATPGASSQTPLTQAPLTQNPSAQAPAKHAPSTQEQHRIQNQGQKPFQLPSRPASDMADAARSLKTI